MNFEKTPYCIHTEENLRGQPKCGKAACSICQRCPTHCLGHVRVLDGLQSSLAIYGQYFLGRIGYNSVIRANRARSLEAQKQNAEVNDGLAYGVA